MSVRSKVVGDEKFWLADYKDGSGARHQVRFKRKKDAEQHEEQSKVSIRARTYVEVDSSFTIEQAADVWLRRVEANGMRNGGALERATMRQYSQHVRLHILPRIGRLKLAKLGKGDVAAFRDKLLSKEGGVSRPMARKVMVSFKSMLKANGVGHLAADVSIGQDARAKHLLEIGKDIPTPAEIRRLIEAARPNAPLHALLLVASTCGLRASELRGLRWSDVDLKAEEIHVRQRADRYGTIGRPKTKESTRTLPLTPETLSALRAWKMPCPKGELDLCFPTRTGRVEHHTDLRRRLAPVMRAAGLATKAGKPRYGMHSLRHFFASWCINPKDRGGRGLSPKVAQSLLGHSSIVMTLDRYGHLFPVGDDRNELAAASRALLG
jgi:integrase